MQLLITKKCRMMQTFYS